MGREEIWGLSPGHSMTNRLERWKVAWEGALGKVGGEPLQCGVLETRYKFILHVTVWEANLKCRSDLITPLTAWQGVHHHPQHLHTSAWASRWSMTWRLPTLSLSWLTVHSLALHFSSRKWSVCFHFWDALCHVILSYISWNCLSSLITLPSSLSSNIQFIN